MQFAVAFLYFAVKQRDGNGDCAGDQCDQDGDDTLQAFVFDFDALHLIFLLQHFNLLLALAGVEFRFHFRKRAVAIRVEQFCRQIALLLHRL